MGFSLWDIATYISAAIGAASLVVQAAEKITGITPSQADDEFVSKVKVGLAKVVRIADRLALNPPAPKARDR